MTILLVTILTNYFIYAEIIGPDFRSYTNALSNGLNTFMLRELVSWWLISNFTQSYAHLWIFVAFLQTVLILLITIFCIKNFAGNRKFDSKLFLIVSILLFVVLNPFTLLLTSSALRQGIGAVFFICSLQFFNKKYWPIASGFALFSIFSHNSYAIFYVMLLVLSNFKFINLELKLVITTLVLIILSTFFIPKADLVSDSNLILYLISNILALVLASKNKNLQLKVLVYALVGVPIGFIGDYSYFDRFSLLTSAIVWPILVAAYYGPMKQKIFFIVLFLLPSVVFLRTVSRFEVGW
jgi:hypothetical protein